MKEHFLLKNGRSEKNASAFYRNTNNLINCYMNRPNMFLNYTLADFAAKLNIVYPKGFRDDESTNYMDNDDGGEDNDQSVILLYCSNGVIF